MIILKIVYTKQLYPTMIYFENELHKSKLQAVQATYDHTGMIKCTINANSEVDCKTVDSMAYKLFGKAYLGFSFT